MPLDGLSSANTGMYRFITPSENALQAEHTAKNQAEEVIKKLEKSEKSNNNLDKNDENGQNDLQGRDSSGENEEQEIFIEGKENLKKYRVKFNPKTNMVEFIDKKTNEVIEVISPEDLLNLVSKTIKPSGILVDRQI